MQPERKLRDIVAAAEELAGYLEEDNADDFAADRLRQRAVERVLTLIGEAAKQLPVATREAIDQPWREIIRFRDKGIHHYDSLSPEMLYRIATTSVPRLAQAVHVHLQSSSRA